MTCAICGAKCVCRNAGAAICCPCHPHRARIDSNWPRTDPQTILLDLGETVPQGQIADGGNLKEGGVKRPTGQVRDVYFCETDQWTFELDARPSIAE